MKQKTAALNQEYYDTMIKLAQEQLADPQRPDVRECDYNGTGIRRIPLEVCIWHLEENDPACLNCAYKP